MAFIDVRTAFVVSDQLLQRRPSYDHVLIPLRQAQKAAEDARVAAAQAARREAAQQAQQAASEQQQAAQNASPQATGADYSGKHEAWMERAGINPSDYTYVDYIMNHESGWSPTKFNYSGSGAYGLGQALPASKMAAYGADYITNPVTQLEWASGYATSRYGSWHGAYLAWTRQNWW
jgi:hypothetical protein